MLWIADALRAEGCQVIETAGWRDRGHGDMGDIRGVLTHHTGGGGSNDWIIVRDGRPDLAGPLAQLTLELDGSFRVIAVGVCWHAGSADNQNASGLTKRTWFALATGWDDADCHIWFMGSHKTQDGTGVAPDYFLDFSAVLPKNCRQWWQAPDNTDQIGAEYRSRNPVSWEIEKTEVSTATWTSSPKPGWWYWLTIRTGRCSGSPSPGAGCPPA